MRPLPFLVLAAPLVAACAAEPEGLPFFGDGYRAPGDPCLRVGENEFTNQFLDDSSDLVGCPRDMENLGVFVTETGAVLVAQTEDANLYSVPLR
ncbi:hypothetical protein [Wenxinia marina]|uniref:Uncharacterized protein n=1 Tax=Wenxinia marina DSM 24838 TaxID=1123501 RepID=A0A0D0NMX8_9RHOB|nr:hypothetical protein [Wenxinia marina]KIQ69635.1 hypothetical protein Wenmar_01999 [Wenxinia marina DSM 24838]GGL59936.1 hypothetical protein GCM10011392_13060 [Wenxinia marina]